MIWVSYLAIPAVLIYFIRRRREMPFPWIFWLFGLFIVSCGFTHLMEVVTNYLPMYRLSGIIKLVTAVASMATVAALVPVTPRALAMRGPAELEREIEERKRVENVLAERNRQLVETERLKSQFFANVSHELRTPLTLVLAPLESILAGEYGAVSRLQGDNLQTIHNNAVRLLQMVNGILDYSKLEAGKLEVDRQPVDAAGLTRSIVADFRPIFEHRGLEIQIEAPPSGLAVMLDRYLFERILFNLLSNAAKFTPLGGKVSITLKHESGRLRLTVADTGIGIAAADVPKLFQKFRQLESSSSRRFEGTGLGLSLVKEFAELLGGRVAVESTSGQGSTFIVEVAAPLSTSPAAVVKDAGAPRQWIQKFEVSRPLGEERSAQETGLPKVLVAEDNLELASYITSLLGSAYQIRIAENGEDALQQVLQWLPDLVLADVMMPKRDGLSLCRDIKANPATAKIPVILLTALTHREALLKGWEAGADEYLFKPFHPKELATRVRTILAAFKERS